MIPVAAVLSTIRGKATEYAFIALVAVSVPLCAYVIGMENARTKAEAEKASRNARAAEVQADQAKATVQVVTKYVDRVRIVRQKADTIIKEVPVYVPSDACPLPGGFRLLHDAAASGEPADPAGISDAAPVEPQAAAATVADNYTACRLNAEQLTAMQAWVRETTEAAR